MSRVIYDVEQLEEKTFNFNRIDDGRLPYAVGSYVTFLGGRVVRRGDIFDHNGIDHEGTSYVMQGRMSITAEIEKSIAAHYRDSRKKGETPRRTSGFFKVDMVEGRE